MAKRKTKSRYSKTKNSAWSSTIAIVAFLIAIAALAISATSSGNLIGGAVGTGIVANSCNGDAVCETHKLQARADITTLKDITAQGLIKSSGDLLGKNLVVQSNIKGSNVNAAESITAGKSVTGSKIFADFLIQPTVLQGLQTVLFEKDNIKYKVTLKDVPSSTEAVIEVIKPNSTMDQRIIAKGTGVEINGLGVFVEEVFDISSSDAAQDTARVFLGTPIRPVGNIESTGPIIATQYMQLDGCMITVNKLTETLNVEC